MIFSNCEDIKQKPNEVKEGILTNRKIHGEGRQETRRYGKMQRRYGKTSADQEDKEEKFDTK